MKGRGAEGWARPSELCLTLIIIRLFVLLTVSELPAATAVRVHDSTADCRYVVLPERPRGTEGWSEAELAALVTRDSMIGVSLPVARLS